MDEGRGDANARAMFVAGFGVIRPEADHDINQADQSSCRRADQRVEIAPLRHDVVQASPPFRRMRNHLNAGK